MLFSVHVCDYFKYLLQVPCSKMEDSGPTPGPCSKMEDSGPIPGPSSKLEDSGPTPGPCSKMDSGPTPGPYSKMDSGPTPGPCSKMDAENQEWAMGGEEGGEEEAIQLLAVSCVIRHQGTTSLTIDINKQDNDDNSEPAADANK